MERNSIKYSVPTNWQADFLEKLPTKDVVEVYGRLATDFIGGGGMFNFNLPSVTREEISKHVAQIHNRGLEFNYLLNGSCIDNLEWTRKGQKEIRNLLDWLVSIKADSVTITIPYLTELIKDCYPTLKVIVSSFAGVDTVLRAKRWLGLGADGIILASYKVNRDFSLLNSFRKNIPCQLQLIANERCLYSCPMYSYHANIITHHSQSSHSSSSLTLDPCKPFCTSLYLRSPERLISSNWIRPEDIRFYEELGIDRIKLVSGGMSTEAICKIVRAYIDRSYPGNLYHLFPDPEQKGEIYIDNQLLNGFLKYFLEEKCSGFCKQCRYCKRIAEKIVKIDSIYAKNILQDYESKMKDIAPEFLLKEEIGK